MKEIGLINENKEATVAVALINLMVIIIFVKMIIWGPPSGNNSMSLSFFETMEIMFILIFVIFQTVPIIDIIIWHNLKIKYGHRAGGITKLFLLLSIISLEGILFICFVVPLIM